MNSGRDYGWRKASYSNHQGSCVEVGNSGWRKASFSNGQGACVETASLAGTVAVRDTTNRHGGSLVFTADAWRAFTGKLRGEN